MDRSSIPPHGTLIHWLRATDAPLGPAGGEALYRHVALLAGLDPSRPVELLDVACGGGEQLAFLAHTYGVHGSGVDPDPGLVRRATNQAQSLGLADRMHVQEGSATVLPYRDGMFDVVIGEPAAFATGDMAAILSELARVTREGGRVILLGLIAERPVDPVASRRLGLTPLPAHAWRDHAREVGFGQVQVVEWNLAERAMRPATEGGFPGNGDAPGFLDRLALGARVRKAWGWRAAAAALRPSADALSALTGHPDVRLALIQGVRGPAEEAPARQAPRSVDLPLFGVEGSGDPAAPKTGGALASSPLHAAPDAAPVVPAELNLGDRLDEADVSEPAVPERPAPPPRTAGSAPMAVDDLPLFEAPQRPAAGGNG